MDSFWRPEEGSTASTDAGTEVEILDLWKESRPPAKDLTVPETDIWEIAPSPELPDENRAVADVEGPVTRGELSGRESQRRRRPTRLARPTRSRRRRRVITMVIPALLISLLLADGAWVALKLRSTLQQTAAGIGQAGRSIESGDLAGARQKLAAALERASDASAAVKRPSVRVASLLPVVGPEARSIRGLATASQLAARAGIAAVDALSKLGLTEAGVGAAIYQNGVVDVDALRAASPLLSRAEEFLVAAEQELRVGRPSLLEEVIQARRDAMTEVMRARGLVSNAVTLFGVLPGLLGADGPRSYLLAFQALGESRATGGVVGLYGILHADNGRIALAHVGPYTDLGRVGPVDAPTSWFEESYGTQSALKEWPQANVSPNFSTVGEVFLRMYEKATGEVLDGVLAMDPITLEKVLGAMPPLVLGDSSAPITSSNVAEILLVDSYRDFTSSDEQNDFLAGVVDTFWDALAEGRAEPQPLAQAVADAVATQHLKVYLREEAAHAAMETLGAAGAYSKYGENVQMVFTNNYSVNKVDYFLERQTITTVRPMTQDTLEVQVEVVLRNTAPAGAADLLLGSGVGNLPPGANRTLLNILMPTNAVPSSVGANGRKAPLLTYLDGAHPVAWSLIDLFPGETESRTFTYTLPGYSEDGQTLALIPQTTVRPERYEVRVPGLADNNLEITRGTLSRPVRIQVFAGGSD